MSSLNLSNCDLSTKGANGLCTIFAVLPKNIISLDLSNNDFCEIGTKEYIEGMSDINLTDYQKKCMFEHPMHKIIPTDDFIRAFSLIPKNIRAINLSNNGFNRREESELIKIINAIPETVETILIEENSKIFNLIQKIRHKTYDTLCESLPDVMSSTVFSYITTGHTFWNKKNTSIQLNSKIHDDDHLYHLKVR